VLVLFGIRHIALYGFVSEVDEGTEAHLFQLLLPVQLIVIAFFAFTWLPRAPRQAVAMLALQIAATIALLGAVYWADHLPLAV
jgi:MFS superfamily sulfate permease-like transporter